VTGPGGHVQIEGLRLHVRDVGSGPPVLLLNGIGAHAAMWGPIERALPGRRVVSFDAPGTGRSQTSFVPRTMAGLADLAARVLDHLELDRVDVLGYSFGGAMAQEFALRYPSRVGRLVLAATFPGWGGVPGRLQSLLAMATPLRYYSRSFFELTTPHIAGGRTRTDPEHVRRMWAQRAGHAPSPLGYAQQLWALSTWSSLPRLGAIDAPTLVVVGDDDPLVPVSNALLMASRIPAARVLVCPGEGHFQLLDEDSAAVQAVREFIRAKKIDDAPAWRRAVTIEPAEAGDRVRSDGIGALPWGAVSALFRRTFPANDRRQSG
jgi:pimeloyl-ACP methyl ester carboxylesterase